MSEIPPTLSGYPPLILANTSLVTSTKTHHVRSSPDLFSTSRLILYTPNKIHNTIHHYKAPLYVLLEKLSENISVENFNIIKKVQLKTD